MLNKKDFLVLFLTLLIFLLGIADSGCSLNLIGITLDISGFLLLWRFGLPTDIKPDGNIVGTQWDVQQDINEKFRYNFAKVIGHLSLVIILVGFIFQYLGS